MKPKGCSVCGGTLNYQWEDIGDSYLDTCVECMLTEMREDEKTHNTKIGSAWLEAIKK